MNAYKLTGFAAAIGSALIAGSTGLFVRQVDLSGEGITFFRLAVGLVFLLAFMGARQKFQAVSFDRSFAGLVGAGVCLSLVILCYIHAINHTSLSKAVFLLYLGPLFALLLSWRSGESPSWGSSSALAMSVGGLGLLVGFDFKTGSGPETQGILWGLGAALSYGLYIQLNRRLPSQLSVYNRTLVQLLVGAFVMTPALEVGELARLDSTDLGWLTGIGFFHGFLAILLVVVAISRLKTAEYVTLSYLDPWVAAFIGYGVYDESLGGAQMAGGLLILSAGMMQLRLSSESKGRTKRNKQEN